MVNISTGCAKINSNTVEILIRWIFLATNYAWMLQKFRKAIDGVRFLHDNTPDQKSHACCPDGSTTMRLWNFSSLTLDPYLVPSDVHLFPTMNSFVNGKHVSEDDMLISELKSWLLTQHADVYIWRACMQKLLNPLSIKIDLSPSKYQPAKYLGFWS